MGDSRRSARGGVVGRGLWSMVGEMPSPRPWVLALVVACTYDGSGQGEPPDPETSSGADAATSTGAPATTSGPATSLMTGGETGDGASGDASGATTGEAALTEAGTTSTATSSATSEATTAETSTTDETTGEPPPPETTGPPSCEEMFYKGIALVLDAQVVPPMVAEMSTKGEGIVAYSSQSEQGTVTFSFDLPCAGSFALWGRVLDAEPGVNNYDPDSFYVRVDGGAEGGWYYGCQTTGLPSGYHWLRVRTGQQGAPCDQQAPLTVDLSAGVHTVTLRNREQQDGQGNVAAVARVLLVNDPNYTPAPPD